VGGLVRRRRDEGIGEILLRSGVRGSGEDWLCEEGTVFAKHSRRLRDGESTFGEVYLVWNRSSCGKGSG